MITLTYYETRIIHNNNHNSNMAFLLTIDTSAKKANALLRCEQRNTEATAYHLKHYTQRIVKMPRVANHS